MRCALRNYNLLFLLFPISARKLQLRPCIFSATHMKELQMKSLLTTLLGVFALSVSLSACNTVEGAGKDVKAAGTAVERAADDSKPK